VRGKTRHTESPCGPASRLPRRRADFWSRRLQTPCEILRRLEPEIAGLEQFAGLVLLAWGSRTDASALKVGVESDKTVDEAVQDGRKDTHMTNAPCCSSLESDGQGSVGTRLT
jgi:hypothetical protein